MKINSEQIKPRVEAITHIGNTRSINEDSILSDEELQLYVIADGMGGHAGGEIASLMASTEIKKYIFDIINTDNSEQPISKMVQLLNDGFLFVNNIVSRENLNRTGRGTMGTTLSVVFIYKNTVYYGNIGDSRIYYFDGTCNNMKKLSIDHTMEQKMLDSGVPSHLAASRKNMLTQCIGNNSIITPNIGSVKVIPGSSILLCSDGFYNYFSDKYLIEQLEAFEQKYENAILKKMIDLVLSMGGEDNISAILIKF